MFFLGFWELLTQSDGKDGLGNGPYAQAVSGGSSSRSSALPPLFGRVRPKSQSRDMTLHPCSTLCAPEPSRPRFGFSIYFPQNKADLAHLVDIWKNARLPDLHE